MAIVMMYGKRSKRHLRRCLEYFRDCKIDGKFRCNL